MDVDRSEFEISSCGRWVRLVEVVAVLQYGFGKLYKQAWLACIPKLGQQVGRKTLGGGEEDLAILA